MPYGYSTLPVTYISSLPVSRRLQSSHYNTHDLESETTPLRGWPPLFNTQITVAPLVFSDLRWILCKQSQAKAKAVRGTGKHFTDPSRAEPETLRFKISLSPTSIGPLLWHWLAQTATSPGHALNTMA
jgi:hypothetical protein